MVDEVLEAYIICDGLPYDSRKIDIGAVSEITEPYTSALTSVPIMGLPSERRILMDTSVSTTKTLKYKRVSPKNPIDDYTVDSTNWSNGFWIFNIQRYIVNRFQMDTDGCKLYFKVIDKEKGTSDLYPSILAVNGYIDTFDMDYSAGSPFEISGDITFKVGSCRGSKEGIYTITYHSNFKTVTDKITSEATYTQVYYSSSANVDTYPIAWEQLLRSTMGSSVPTKDGWWWCPSSVELFDYAYKPEGEGNRAFRWKDDEGGKWEDLPSHVTQANCGSDLHLYARYDGFWDKWNYLGSWDCANGTANPELSESYPYQSGQFFIVSNVSSSKNYKPDGEYYKKGSKAEETGRVKVGDRYVFRDAKWWLESK